MYRSLRGLLAFSQVVDTKSFSAAAHTLGITKSAVSKLVAGLEAELGVQLLVRTTRKLSLTEVGERVYAAASRLGDDLEAAHQAALSHKAGVVGQLRVTAPAVLGRDYLLPRVSEFLAANASAKIELILADRYLDLVESRIDVAFRVGHTLADSTLVARRIADVSLIVCGSPRYLARYGVPRTPADLEQHSFALHRTHLETDRMTFQKGKAAVTVALSGRFACNDGVATAAYAAAGHGLVIAPAWEFGDRLVRRKLVPVLEDWSLGDMTLSAVFPPHRHLPTKVRAFVDFIAASWKKPPWDF
jgi:DNA-binding transcriptional LysR family regulator